MEEKSYKTYLIIWVFTILCCVPNTFYLYTKQFGEGFSGFLYALGQLVGLFTLVLFPVLGLYHLGYLIAFLFSKEKERNTMIFFGLSGVLASLFGFALTEASFRSHVGF